MATVTFEDVSPGDIVSYWQKIPGTTAHRYRVIQVRTVLDSSIWLTTDFYRVDRHEVVEGSIRYAAKQDARQFTDREGDTVTIGSNDEGVTMTIPGYGTMTFDPQTAGKLLETLRSHLYDVEITAQQAVKA